MSLSPGETSPGGCAVAAGAAEDGNDRNGRGGGRAGAVATDGNERSGRGNRRQ